MYRRRRRGALVVPGKCIGSNTFARRPDALAVGNGIVYCILCVGYAERPRRVNAQFVVSPLCRGNDQRFAAAL